MNNHILKQTEIYIGKNLDGAGEQIRLISYPKMSSELIANQIVYRVNSSLVLCIRGNRRCISVDKDVTNNFKVHSITDIEITQLLLGMIPIRIRTYFELDKN